MSFREIKLGKGGQLVPPAPAPKANTRGRVKNTKATTKPPTGELLYSRMRLVPSSSGESSTDSFDSQSATHDDGKSLSSTKRYASITPRSIASRQSPSRSTPSSGTTSSRGIPGFFTPTHPRNIDAPNLRGWSQPNQGDIVHHTGVSPISISKTTGVQSRRPQKRAPLVKEVVYEIAHFQKLVAQIVDTDNIVNSPEQQWRRRILIRSAQDANLDIAAKLDLLDGRNRVSKELYSDYQQASALLSKQLELIQQDENSLAAEEDSPDYSLQQEQEDYFVRVSREREEEIKSINQKMHTVGKIYNDLAAIIYDQQDQIDALEENVHSAKINADGGLKHIQNARNSLCLMDTSFEAPQCGGGLGDVEEGSEARSVKVRSKAPSDEKVQSWYKPFHSFQKDILGLGNDMASLSCSISETLECGRKN